VTVVAPPAGQGVRRGQPQPLRVGLQRRHGPRGLPPAGPGGALRRPGELGPAGAAPHAGLGYAHRTRPLNGISRQQRLHELPPPPPERCLEDHEVLLEVQSTWSLKGDTRFAFCKNYAKYEFFRKPTVSLTGQSEASVMLLPLGVKRFNSEQEAPPGSSRGLRAHLGASGLLCRRHRAVWPRPLLRNS